MNSWSPQILFEDNHLLVVNKAPGEICQGDKTGDEPLPEKLKTFLKERDEKPGNVFLGVVHRLDRPASGVVVLAKTSKALERMNAQIRDREIEKTYWAIVPKRPDLAEGRLEHWLIKDQANNRSKIVRPNTSGAKLAVLTYALRASLERYHLIEVSLETGRHHQIRVQLSAIGCPIRGDLKYGSKRSNQDGSVSLHASRLRFVHPVRKDIITINAPPPPDPLWRLFVKALGET
ncbi:MAG: RNA pseudouridine synthase [Bacteroidetes bacterium]|nr:RNA pseudouridine synthase [Bacteroidota bacterium]